MTYRLPYPTYKNSYGEKINTFYEDLKEIERYSLSKIKDEFISILISKDEDKLNSFIGEKLHTYKILQTITGLDINDDEQYMQIREIFEYRFGLNDLIEKGQVLV